MRFSPVITLIALSLTSNTYAGFFDVRYQFSRGDSGQVLVVKSGSLWEQQDLICRKTLISLFTGDPLRNVLLKPEHNHPFYENWARPLTSLLLPSWDDPQSLSHIYDAATLLGERRTSSIFLLGESVDYNPFSLQELALKPDLLADSNNHFFIAEYAFSGEMRSVIHLDFIGSPYFAAETRSPGFKTFIDDYQYPSAFAVMRAPDLQYFIAASKMGIGDFRKSMLYRVRHDPVSKTTVPVKNFGVEGFVTIPMETIEGVTVAPDKSGVWVYTTSSYHMTGNNISCVKVSLDGKQQRWLVRKKFSVVSMWPTPVVRINPTSQQLFHLRGDDTEDTGLLLEAYSLMDAYGESTSVEPQIAKIRGDIFEDDMAIDLLANNYGGVDVIGRSAKNKNFLIIYRYTSDLKLIGPPVRLKVFANSYCSRSCLDEFGQWEAFAQYGR